MRYGKIEQKSEDDPDPAYLTPCGAIPLRGDSTSSDGINSSIRLEGSDLEAVGAGEKDLVRVYVEANGRWVEYERKTYADRAGIGLPYKARQKLDLSPDDTIEVWLGEVEQPDQEQLDETDDTTIEGSRTNFDRDEEYVWLFDEGAVYHHIRPDKDKTVCGIDFSDLEAGEQYKLLSDPGDVLEECEECALRSTGDMTNRELVEWIGDEDRADFEPSVDAPAYLSKSQLTKIRDYIIDLEMDLMELEEAQQDEAESNEDDSSTPVLTAGGGADET